MNLGTKNTNSSCDTKKYRFYCLSLPGLEARIIKDYKIYE